MVRFPSSSGCLSSLLHGFQSFVFVVVVVVVSFDLVDVVALMDLSELVLVLRDVV